MSDSVELVHFDTSVEPFQTPVLDVVVDYIKTDYQTRPALLNKPAPTRWNPARRPALSAAAAITLIAVTTVVWFQTRPDNAEASNTDSLAAETTPQPEPAAPNQELFNCELDLAAIPAAMTG